MIVIGLLLFVGAVLVFYFSIQKDKKATDKRERDFFEKRAKEEADTKIKGIKNKFTKKVELKIINKEGYVTIDNYDLLVDVSNYPIYAYNKEEKELIKGTIEIFGVNRYKHYGSYGGSDTYRPLKIFFVNNEWGDDITQHYDEFYNFTLNKKRDQKKVYPLWDVPYSFYTNGWSFLEQYDMKIKKPYGIQFLMKVEDFKRFVDLNWE